VVNMKCILNTNHSSLIPICACVFITTAIAQTQKDSSSVALPDEQQSTERLLDQVETEADNSEIIDRLNWLQEHPINLNTVGKEELATIPRLSPAEVTAIVSFRQRVGKFSSVDQLAVMENGGEEILRKIRPYIFVENADASGLSSTSINFTSRATKDLQPRAGFQDTGFVGSALKNYSRLTIDQAGRLQAGVLFEKDAGERIGDSFLSGYLAVKDWSFISQAIVGDYVVEAGQGLVFWRATAFGKGSEAVSVVKKTGLGVQAYRSADEFNFMRGVAVSSNINVGENKLAVTALFSRRALSASGNDESVSSFYEEGLFRTQSELQKKSNVVERIVGGRLQYNSIDEWSVGGSFYRSSFDKPIIADRVFEFNGSSATVIGVDAEMNLGWLGPKLSQVTLFGEAARSGDGAGAGIVGSILNLTRNASLALVYRDYSPRFTSLHATGIGERSDTKNERGFYIGTDLQLNKWLHLSGYLDHFKFPWRTFDNPLPTSGRDLLLQADASVTRTLDLTFRYTNKTTETTEASVDDLSRETRLLVDRSQQKFRLTATYQANKQLRLRGRIEKTIVDYRLLKRSESGYLFYQELRYSASPGFTAEARLIFFDTDSYDSRLYEYENDLRGVFSNPAMYGKGRRWYVLMRWKAADILNLSAKYSETQKDGVTSIGSGLTEIQGDLDNRISVQLDVKF